MDAARIGVIGYSKGGMEAWLAAAVEPRIAAVVPLISVQSFRYELEKNAWQARIDRPEWKPVAGVAWPVATNQWSLTSPGGFYRVIAKSSSNELHSLQLSRMIGERP